MHALILGENAPINSQTINFSDNVSALGYTKADEVVKLNSPLSTLELEQKQIIKVEFFSKQKEVKAFVNDFEMNATHNGFALLVGRVYLHNGVWKVKSLGEPFNTESSFKVYTKDAPVFVSTAIQELASNVQETVQNKVATIRQNENVQRAEQIATTTAKIATETAQIAANGVKQVFSHVMGNDDSIAQQQARNERFQPLDLTKMQSVSFDSVVPPLKNLHLGLGWKAKKGTGLLTSLVKGGAVNVDLDLSVQLLSYNGEVVDTVYFDKTRSDNLAVCHYGDASQGGNGLQDNEIISVALESLPKEVAYIAVTATSNKGHTFNGLESGFFRVLNQQAMLPLVQIAIDPVQATSACLLGIFSRNTLDQWQFIAIQDYLQATTIKEPNMEQLILNWSRTVGQTRGIVPQQSSNLLPNYQIG